MPTHAIESVDAVAAVHEVLEPVWIDNCETATAYRGTLTDGKTVRLFALTDAVERQKSRERFEKRCAQWAQHSQRGGVTPVVDRGTDPVPWIAVEDGGTALSACREELSAAEIKTIVESVAETLHSVGQPHHGIRPELIRVHRSDDTLRARLDWTITSLCSETHYTAPELVGVDSSSPSQSAGTQTADVYSLGALLWDALDPADVNSELEAVCATAMADDPADRYHSVYAFKRALLFQSQPVGPGDSANQTVDRPDTEEYFVSSEVGSGTEKEHGQQADTDESERPEESEKAEENEQQDTGIQLLTRRKVIAATGIGAAGIAAAGLQQFSGTNGGSEPAMGFDVSYDRGLLELRYAGESEFDPAAVQIMGAGFTGSPELAWSELVDHAPITEDGETVALAVDPAYDIELIHDSEGILMSDSGPEASDSRPDWRRQPVPEMAFSFERSSNGSDLQIRYEEGPTVLENHLTLSDRDDDSRQISESPLVVIEPGEEFAYDETPTTVLSIEWSPPYVDDSTALAQYQGTDRPLDPEITGVSAPQYDSTNTGYTSNQGPESAPTESWTFDGFENDSAGSDTIVAVVDGRLFVNSSHRLYALDASDGTVLWRRYLGTQRVLAPIAAHGTVFVGSVDSDDDPVVAAVDPETGSVEWTFSTDADVLFSPVVTAGVAATGSFERIYFLDPNTGEQSLSALDRGQSTRSAIDDQLLYAISQDELLRAHTPDELEWELENVIQIAPTATAATVYVIREQELDATGGELRSLTAVDRTDGTVRWEYGLTSRRTLAPVVADETVMVVEGSGKSHGIDSESGDQLWDVTAAGDVWADPVAASETLYVGSTDESVQAFDIADGTERWRLDLPTTPDDLAVVAGTLYVVGQDNQVFCFRLDTE